MHFSQREMSAAWTTASKPFDTRYRYSHVHYICSKTIESYLINRTKLSAILS